MNDFGNKSFDQQINKIAIHLKVSRDDVENVLALLFPEEIKNFPTVPQAESMNAHKIMDYITLFSADLSNFGHMVTVQRVFTSRGLCFSFNQLNLSELLHSP